MAPHFFHFVRLLRLQHVFCAWWGKTAEHNVPRSGPDRLPAGALGAHAKPHTPQRTSALPCKSLVAQRSQALRVIRELESGQCLGTAGRMRISGRMADVCAELERLVERETARI